jgi:hypothetical protein
MDAVRTRRDGYVESIVHHHPCSCAANHVDTGGYQTRQRTAVQIAFTDLDEMYAFYRCRTHACDEAVFPGRAKAPSIGDETKDRTHTVPTKRSVYFS